MSSKKAIRLGSFFIGGPFPTSPGRGSHQFTALTYLVITKSSQYSLALRALYSYMNASTMKNCSSKSLPEVAIAIGGIGMGPIIPILLSIFHIRFC
jgi:hypothetical protein